uniref:Uncharacterized protein LOC104238124 n=1 Tax=Nicotiana sylvestris TaxID=4096 RepID=A0A1U7XF56_NICSY|nr:PREDICTED: uncharacterized protein LOC104238124 [Nicotiana sylvestris]
MNDVEPGCLRSQFLGFFFIIWEYAILQIFWRGRPPRYSMLGGFGRVDIHQTRVAAYRSCLNRLGPYLSARFNPEITASYSALLLVMSYGLGNHFTDWNFEYES